MNKKEKILYGGLVMIEILVATVSISYSVFTKTPSPHKEEPAFATKTIEIVCCKKEDKEEILSLEVPSKRISFNSTDMEILYHVASAEAGARYPQGMKNVVTVILNRLFSNDFPKDTSIHETVFRYRQFSCVMDGNYSKAAINEQVVKAVNDAVCEYFDDTIEKTKATFFANLKICDPKWVKDMEMLPIDAEGDVYIDEAGHSFFIPKK